jgi:RimJ/RimL family protein N-acetyltransferase
MAEHLIILTDRENVLLRELATAQDDIAYFEAIEEDRDHLNRYGNQIAQKYETLKAVRDRRLTAGSDLRMGIWDNEDELKGMISGRPNHNGTEAEIGYWLRASAVGNGYATLAVNAMAAYLRPKYARVFAEVHFENIASGRVLERAGFVKTDVDIRKWGPTVIYELPAQ